MMSGVKLNDSLDAGRPYGSTREEFLAACDGKMEDWLQDVEQRHGLLDRISSVRLKDGRLIMLARFAQSWMVNFWNPENKPSERELQCFLSFEAMYALWALHKYLTTARTNEQAWEAFMAAVEIPKRGD